MSDFLLLRPGFIDPSPVPEPTPPVEAPLTTELPPAKWKWAIGDQAASIELTAARARKLAFRLDAAGEASFSIDGRSEQAAALTELVTDVHVFRDDRQLFRGRVSTTQDQAGTDRHSVNVTVGDYRALLAGRILWTDETFTGDDQADIAWALIEHTQALPGGDLGITQGAGNPTGVTRDRTYPAGKQIGEALTQLSQVINGFEWEINADLELDIWHPQRGGNNGVILDYGGLVVGFSRMVNPSTYANAVRYTGADGVTPEELEAADIATRPEGRFDRQYGDPDISLATTLADRAEWQLAEAQDVRPSWTVTLRARRWRGPDHIWLGDTCRLLVRSGRLDVDEEIRVFGVTIDISDDGEETVSLELGAAPPDFARRAAEQARRLTDLERR